jgi:hypothetical protein
VANPKYVTLAANVESVVTLDANFGSIEVALVANADLTCFNTTGTPIGSVSGPVDGCHTLTSSLPAKVVADGTAGQASVVRLRSVGTPTVQVCGL